MAIDRICYDSYRIKIMECSIDAYLDIETTGLSFTHNYITLIGIYRCKDTECELIQLVGEQVTKNNLLSAIEGVSTIYTYNGKRFDLPFIHRYLQLNLETKFNHHDIMFDCWQKDLFGGFKAVERKLGICRQLQGVDGYEAVLLWQRYKEYNDLNALETLLKYNEEDVVNLKALREYLNRLYPV